MSEQRLLALSRYIRALEQGDIETLATILHEASHDPVLSTLLEETDAIYHTIDGTTVTRREARQALQAIFASSQNHHGRQDQFTASLLPDVTRVQRNEGTSMKTQATYPLPEISSRHQPPIRKRGRWLQLCAALLSICVLIGAAVILLNIYQQRDQNPAISQINVTPPRGVVVAVAGTGENTVYSSIIYGLRLDTGKLLWTFKAPRVQEGASTGNGVIVQDQSVYVLVNSQVYALRATDGKLLWHTDLFVKGTQQDSYSAFLFDQNMLYISGVTYDNKLIQQGKLFALHSTNGSIAWHYENYDSPLLAAHNGVVYTITDGNTATYHLRALRGNDGKQLWIHEGKPISAVVDDTTAYVTFTDPTMPSNPEGTLAALNAQTGELHWFISVPANGVDTLQLAQGKLFLEQELGNGDQICAWQTANGHQIWCHLFKHNTFDSTIPFRVVNNILYVFSNPNNGVSLQTPTVQGTAASQPTVHQETMVQAYSTNDGKTLLWKTVLNDVYSGETVSNQDQVYVITNRHLWKLDQHGNVLWSDPNPLPASNKAQFSVQGEPATGSW